MTSDVYLDGALCAQLDIHEINRLYPSSDINPHRPNRRDEHDARTLCRQCPALAGCLELALSLGDAASGIWAATNPTERHRIRAQTARGKQHWAGFGWPGEDPRRDT